MSTRQLVRKSEQFDVLVFDWDGTLMDSELHIVSCLEVAMQAVGVVPRPAEELKQVIGLGLDEALAALMPEQALVTQQQAKEAFRNHFLAPKPLPSALFPGAKETLSELRNLGYLLAIATGKSRRGLDKALRETGLDEYFVSTRCADETFSKPHPLMLEEILTDLDTPPSRAVMIGDTEFDLRMAANAGMPALGVSYGVHAVERLRPQAPLAIFDELAEIPPWLTEHTTTTRP